MLRILILRKIRNLSPFGIKARRRLHHINWSKRVTGRFTRAMPSLFLSLKIFLKKKKVKLDNPKLKPSDVIPILKLNHRREFNTGIYPYSMMTSTFTPVDLNKNPKSIKVTTSSQEWCGHTYMQFNQKYTDYHVSGFSYFEFEGDKNQELKTEYLEDELWTRLRINPKSLPTGEFSITPAQIFLRLRHAAVKAYRATGHISQSKDGEIITYILNYKDIQRELKIDFESQYPHQIVGWTEKYKSGFGTYADILETKATINKSIWTDYWSQNSDADRFKYVELMDGIE